MHRRKRQTNNLITEYPVLFGLLLGSLLVGTIIASETWFPWIGKAWETHDRQVRSVWFTVVFFGFCINRYWRWRHLAVFWAGACGLLLIHTLGVMYYTNYVHPLVLHEWFIVFVVDYSIVAFGMSLISRGSRDVDDRDVS